jgi:hypothetical protein
MFYNLKQCQRVNCQCMNPSFTLWCTGQKQPTNQPTNHEEPQGEPPLDIPWVQRSNHNLPENEHSERCATEGFTLEP